MTAFPDFPVFFEALWGYSPFPWQAMLAERVAEGNWPEVLDLPTAAGKTACIDAAVYALARQADWPLGKRVAPRRIWFVVDRRIVVDQAHERALAIATALAQAPEEPLATIAMRLRDFAGTGWPLAVARLRGGVLRDERGWSRIPSQPAVITSTVDQLGSKLLFRSYGSSDLAAPIYAGLAGNDSLILLDEAHCSVPFLETLRHIRNYRSARWAPLSLENPFEFAFLSATPPDGSGRRVFPGEERERALDHPVLRARLDASKPAEMVELPRAVKGTRDDPLVKTACERALEFVSENRKRVAVIVNRIRTAESVAEAIRAEAANQIDVVLLTGRLRPLERDLLVKRWTPFLQASKPVEPPRPVIVVATQCLEVGADFSFDALISEAASLDALRQRFGRLNRTGAAGAAPATLLARAEDVADGADDPIYGRATASTWSILSARAKRATEGRRARLMIDMGVRALDATLADVDDKNLSGCLAPRSEAPVLLPAHLDLFCQTAPRPGIEPDVALFLHGKDRGPPEARVLWRGDLSPKAREAWPEIVAITPPLTSEMLEVPLWRLRAWLERPSSPDESGDVEGAARATESEEVGADTAAQCRPVLVWRGRDRSRVISDPRKVCPGDVVVVPACYGIAGLGQTAPCEDMKGSLDLWERARLDAGQPAALRLHPQTLEPWLGCAPLKRLVNLAQESDVERDRLQEALAEVLAEQQTEVQALPDWLRKREIQDGRCERHPGGGLILFGKEQKKASTEPDLFADDDDVTSIAVAGEEVKLETHTKSVVQTVADLAKRCLPETLHNPIRLAAAWHDSGKLDERFQVILRHGDESAVARGEPPLAKSRTIPISLARRRLIREACGLPNGFRHEMLSVMLAERAATLPEDPNERALVLHLIASHHGHGRPFAPVVLDPDPPPISANLNGVAVNVSEVDRRGAVPAHQIDSGISDRFWRLTRRFGWWGLAFLEALVRLSDWYGSE